MQLTQLSRHCATWRSGLTRRISTNASLVSKNPSCKRSWDAEKENERGMTTCISFSSLLTSCTFESGDRAPGRRPYNQDRDDVRRSFRVAEKFPTSCLVPGRQGPPADYKEHVTEARFQFLVCNVHSACALKAGWEASPAAASIHLRAFQDEGIASGGNRRHRRMCSCGPRPSTTCSVVGGSRSESTWGKASPQ